ncbi:hypothetical protein PV04_02244 [Phialophora macrospora]|uniref:DUF1740-domain-containing protein n=1 Tax=Phialophora macrospora TaxID=1851006 RepID=A0A0D2FTT0_9EURO|nr:hypothetical protein PV04_02244 [Phialophora macrospora]
MSRSQYDMPSPCQRHSRHEYRPSSSTVTRNSTSIAQSESHPNSQSSCFIEDRKGDTQILSYGSLNRTSIPRYRLAGHGCLLGLDSKYRITSRSESSLQVEDAESDSTRKSRKKTLLTNLGGDDEVTTDIQHGLSTPFDLGQDFVVLGHGERRKRRRLTTDPLRTAAEEESEESESAVEEAPAADDPFDTFKKNPIHQRHLELSKATETRPDIASTWLAMIEFQHVLLENNLGHSPSPRSLSEIKISLYEQALSHVKAEDDRHALIIGLVREGRAVWDVEKQASRWQAFLGDNASFELWKLYVGFVQTNSVNFSLEDCLQTHMNWLNAFRVPRPGTPDCQRDSNCVYILLRLTLLLWEAGFTERAVGIWQALLEWNLFHPPTQQLQSNDTMSRFRDFWDREVARIGEEGSKGWVSETDSGLDPKTDKSFQTKNMGIEPWVAAEMELEKTASLPARSLDELSGDDSYRIVLFSDIQDFLFRCCSKSGRGLLVDGFLLFAGLPPVTSSDDARMWKGDPFIYNQSPSGPSATKLVEQGSHDFGMSLQYEEVSFAVKQSMCQTSENHGPRSARLLDLSPEFVRRVIAQLVKMPAEEHLLVGIMEYAVAFDAGIDLKDAKKQAKLLLKDKGDNLKLYDAYALLEYQLGNFESAQKVWSTTLSMRMSFGGHGHMQAFYLWRNWAYSHMCRGQFAQARALISMMATKDFDSVRFNAERLDIQAPSAAAQIKVEQHIKRQIEIAVSNSEKGSLCAVIDVLAFHKYLNRGLRLDVALEAYEDCLKLYAGVSSLKSALIEGIHEQRARFIHAHAVTFRKDFKPRVLSDLLAQSVRMFPDNIVLLILNHYFSQKAGAIDRLRQVNSMARVQQEGNMEESVVPCIFDVLVELNRPSYSGSTNHSIRSAFKRTTQVGSPGHDNVELWKAFVLWETSLIGPQDWSNGGSGGKAKPVPKLDQTTLATQAREALYASLRACPWSKGLCMLAFTQATLKGSLGDNELREVYQNMVDRGMRLHIDISEGLY